MERDALPAAITRKGYRPDDADISNIIRLAELNDATPEWHFDCLKSKTGRLLPVLTNVMLALRSDPAVAGCIALDEMFCGPMLLRPIPESAMAAPVPRPLTDDDVSALQKTAKALGLTMPPSLLTSADEVIE